MLLAPAAWAQRFEISGLVGYGFYHNGSVTGLPGTEQAGITDRIAAGGVIGEDVSEHFSGEVRYLYQAGHPFISMPGFRADMDGETHTVTYDALFHLRSRDHRVRLFLAAGVGAKAYVASGPAPVLHSAPQIGSLVRVNQWTFAGDFGAGVKLRLQRYAILRFEFRDYVTPFPDKQIVALGSGKTNGILHQFTPLVGLGFSF
jgi:hypothetical protein